MMRRYLQITVAGLCWAVVATACSGGCASLRSLFGGSSESPERAEDIEGVYRVSTMSRSDEGCIDGEPSGDGTDHLLRVRRVDGDGASPGAAEGSGSTDDVSTASGRASAVEVVLCRSQKCGDPVWRGTLERSEGREWRRDRGTGTVVEGTTAARHCRLWKRRARLVPTDGGVRFERTERASVVALEGDERCGAELAVESGDHLACRGQLRVRAR